MHIQMKYEAACSTLSRLYKTVNIDDTTIHHTDYVKTEKFAQNHPSEIIELEPIIGHSIKDIVIYTDGSKLEPGITDSAFVVFNN